MSEKKLEVFNVLNFLNSGYDIEDILTKGNFGTFKSSDECIDYLVENEYLTQNSEVESDNYSLTNKAINFLNENQWIDLYMFALVAFKFESYEEYVEKSEEDMITTALNFCDDLISYSLMSNKFIIFMDSLSAKAHVYAYDGDYETFLDYALQHFILGLNPIRLDAETYARYEVINYANIINIKNVVEQFEFGSLKKRFDKVWVKSNIKQVTIPKKTCYKILKKALNGENIDKIRSEVKEKYFNRIIWR